MAQVQTVCLKVYAEWEHETKVWVASSSDISGLTLEAGTLVSLETKLQKTIRKLVEVYGYKGITVLIVKNTH